MTGLLHNKVCIITGAGSGVGLGATRIFAREGAQLILAGRTLDTIESARSEVTAMGAQAIAVVADVSRFEDCERMVQVGVEAFGRVDCALNNAAHPGVQAMTLDYPEDEWDQVIATNLKGVWNCMRTQIRQMMANGGGSIVNVSSAATEPMQPLMSAYVASKYAVNGLTKTAAFEYGPHGIRINALILGTIDTPMLQRAIAQHPPVRDSVIGQHPLGRIGTIEDCGEAAAWALSDRNGFMTGTKIVVDGGYSLPARH